MTTPELVALTRKNPILVGCSVLSIALAAAIYFRSDAVSQANARLDEKSALARRYALNVANASHLKEQLDALTAANTAIAGRMIRASDIGINQQYFYKLESDSGVKLTALSQGRTGASKGNYVPIAFTVTFEGDFTQVMTFLRALEDRTHYVRVLSASMSGGRTGLVTLTLNLEMLGTP